MISALWPEQEETTILYFLHETRPRILKLESAHCTAITCFQVRMTSAETLLSQLPQDVLTLAQGVLDRSVTNFQQLCDRIADCSESELRILQPVFYVHLNPDRVPVVNSGRYYRHRARPLVPCRDCHNSGQDRCSLGKIDPSIGRLPSSLSPAFCFMA
ncbi:hypothetical protein BD769DRAFT_485404 [Suillus cothurnatus]|nr:hypothetical protein BD769DRAFT_485404 [Suillus cothurnatus]